MTQNKKKEIVFFDKLAEEKHEFSSLSEKCFERLFSDYTGSKYGVAVNSGTSALEIVLKAIGIKPFLQGLLLWIMISVSSLLAILHFIK